MLSGLNAMTDILLLSNKCSVACFTSWQDLQSLHFKLDFTQDNVSEQLNYFQEILYCPRIFMTWHESKSIQSWDKRNYKYQMCLCVCHSESLSKAEQSPKLSVVCIKWDFPWIYELSWCITQH